MKNPQPLTDTAIQSIATPAPAALEFPVYASAPPIGRITTLDDLREHLQWAIEVEHFTLPPYLCALYSIDGARNPEAAEVMRSVLVEEMQHMMLAANLLNAVGGRPRIDTPKMLASYPSCMPHGDRSFEVPLLPFGRQALQVFLKIERPAALSAPPEGDRYETISQFYEAIKSGVRELCGCLGQAQVFCGDPARQVTGPFFGGERGNICAIGDLAAALAAIDQIVEQGEGAAHVQVWDGDHEALHPERAEVAHYYRFEELELGRRYRIGDTPQSGPTGDAIAIDWQGVRNMRANPLTVARAAGTPIRAAQHVFNQAYSQLLERLDRTFDGNPQLLMTAIGAMYELKLQAQALMEMPTQDGLTTAGPSFEYVAPELRGKPVPR